MRVRRSPRWRRGSGCRVRRFMRGWPSTRLVVLRASSFFVRISPPVAAGALPEAARRHVTPAFASTSCGVRQDHRRRQIPHRNKTCSPRRSESPVLLGAFVVEVPLPSPPPPQAEEGAHRLPCFGPAIHLARRKQAPTASSLTSPACGRDRRVAPGEGSRLLGSLRCRDTFSPDLARKRGRERTSLRAPMSCSRSTAA